jgi:predicted  nucleic acid-binding Zn-ribbon protein
MSDETAAEGLRGRITRQGEDAIGKLAQDLLENPLISGALSRAFEAREKAAAAQEAAMGALNLPSAADLERLTRRVRSVSQRLEGIEDSVDRVDERLATTGATGLEPRLDAIEARLGTIEEGVTRANERKGSEKRLKAVEASIDALRAELTALRKALPAEQPALAVGQERMSVS